MCKGAESKNSIDIIAFSKTWLNDNNSHRFYFKNIHFICQVINKNRGGSLEKKLIKA